MSLPQIIDSPASWAIAGFAIGFALGVNFPSVLLVAIGLGLFVVYLRVHGPAKQETESRLFAGGPTFVVAWLVGFVLHGIAF